MKNIEETNKCVFSFLNEFTESTELNECSAIEPLYQYIISVYDCFFDLCFELENSQHAIMSATIWWAVQIEL